MRSWSPRVSSCTVSSWSSVGLSLSHRYGWFLIPARVSKFLPPPHIVLPKMYTSKFPQNPVWTLPAQLLGLSSTLVSVWLNLSQIQSNFDFCLSSLSWSGSMIVKRVVFELLALSIFSVNISPHRSLLHSSMSNIQGCIELWCLHKHGINFCKPHLLLAWMRALVSFV